MDLALPKLTRACWRPLRLPLRVPIDTAHGRLVERRGWWLTLEAEGGAFGVADALPLPGFGLESEASVGRGLRCGLAALAAGPMTLDQALDRVDAALPHHPATRACLDLALHDLASRHAGKPLARVLGASRTRVPVAALLTSPDPEGAADEARRRVAQGYRTLKLKLGVASLDADLARAQAARGAVGPELALRFDANGAWSEMEAREALASLRALEPEFVEEPLRDATSERWAELQQASGVALAADESLATDPAPQRWLGGACRVAILKPAVLGGLRATRALAARAATAGVRSVVTSFLDSSAGVAGALAFAASLPEGLAAGLATDDLLARDVGALPPVVGGERSCCDGPGLGIALDGGEDGRLGGERRELCFA